MSGVPVIDLSEESGKVVDAVAGAAEEFGFFQIVGHGVDSALVTELWKQAEQFFAQPMDCLLYTSPSPRDATLSRMPSSA